MILDSFADLNATLPPEAFKELNGLADVIQENDDIVPAQESSVLPPPEPIQPPVPTCVYPPEYGETVQCDDGLFKTFPPFPSPPNIPQNQDIMSYLNLTPTISDSETISKVSSESSSTAERLPQPVLSTENPPLSTYLERRPLSISDICSRTTVDAVEVRQTGKRARNSGDSVTCAKKRKIKQPSKYCHVCVRSGEQVMLAPCANVVASTCRKNVCLKCFEKLGMMNEWENARRSRDIIQKVYMGELSMIPDNAWICLHCRGQCPESAQCKIYARTNKRRHDILKQRKREKEQNLARREELRRERDGRQIAEALINGADIPANLPLPMPLPADLIPEHDRTLGTDMPAPQLDEVPGFSTLQ